MSGPRIKTYYDFPGGSDCKSICLQCGRPGFNPWVEKILWRRKWQPTPVFLPGKSHGQRSLVGYSPWGRKESDTAEWLHTWHIVTDKTHLYIVINKREITLNEVGIMCWYNLYITKEKKMKKCKIIGNKMTLICNCSDKIILCLVVWG